MRDNKGRFKKGNHWRAEALHWNYKWLYEEYIIKQRSAADIAKQQNVTEGNIFYWLKKHKIPRRTISQVRSVKYWGVIGSKNPMFGKTGKENPRYKDGRSPERQRLYAQHTGKVFIKRILRRDDYKCKKCGANNVGKRQLHIHHIKNWNNYPELRFIDSNVVTLCYKCHAWVHSKANKEKEYL